MQIWQMNITSDMQGIVGQALGKHVAVVGKVMIASACTRSSELVPGCLFCAWSLG